MKKKTKVLILLGGVLAGVLIGVTVWKYVHRPEIEEYHIKSTIEHLDGIGLGTGTPQDTYCVMDKEIYGDCEVVPGKYAICYEIEGENERLQDKESFKFREVKQLKKYYISIYDLIQKKTIKSIDMLTIFEKYLSDYQFLIPDTGYPLLGRNGHIYLWYTVEAIPKTARDETIDKDIYLDIETNKIQIDHSGKEVRSFIVDDAFGIDNEGRTWQKEYWQPFKQADWKAYYETNNFNYQNENRDFIYRLNSAVEGCIEVSVSTEVLPQENNILYSRFPEVEQWKGAEGKKVSFYIGGYPTVEEIQAMFVEQK